MSYIIFPRLVWHLIIEYLSYFDRCTLRATCKWLARFENKNPLKYWIMRNDPIILNLGRGLENVQARYGLYVINKKGKYSGKLIKNITIGGNFESLVNFHKKFNGAVRITTAYQHGHYKIIEYGLEPILMMFWRDFKYNYMRGNFIFDEDMTYIGQYYNALKYGAPIKILREIEENSPVDDLIYARFMFYVFSNNLQLVKNCSLQYMDDNKKKNKNVRINTYGMLNKACKNNNPEMVKFILKHPRGYNGRKLRLSSVCKLSCDYTILQILQSLPTSHIKKCLIHALHNGNLFVVKRVVNLI